MIDWETRAINEKSMNQTNQQWLNCPQSVTGHQQLTDLILWWFGKTRKGQTRKMKITVNPVDSNNDQ